MNDDGLSLVNASAAIPSYRKLLIFSSTTVLIWLSEPLLSLVDTTVIALAVVPSSSVNVVTQLASLGPATTLTDSLIYLTYFLSIATTNLIAADLAAKDYRRLLKTSAHVLTVAALLGGACTIFAFAFGPAILARMLTGSSTTMAIGSSVGTPPELMQLAVRYTWIRLSVAVASVMGITMQLLLLVTLDTTTPVLAVLAASVTNIAGDLLLVRTRGVQGAAMATAAASVVSAGILFRAVRAQLATWRVLELQQQQQQAESERPAPPQTQSSGTPSTAAAADQFSLTESKSRSDSLWGISDLDDRNKPIPVFALPDRKSALQLIALSGP